MRIKRGLGKPKNTGLTKNSEISKREFYVSTKKKSSVFSVFSVFHTKNRINDKNHHINTMSAPKRMRISSGECRICGKPQVHSGKSQWYLGRTASDDTPQQQLCGDKL